MVVGGDGHYRACRHVGSVLEVMLMEKNLFQGAREMYQVRCPRCNKLTCRVARGGYVEIRCPRCAHDFAGEVGATRTPIASD